MRILFVASAAQVEGAGGGVTHTRAMLGMLRGIPGADVTCHVLPLPLAAAPAWARRAGAVLRSLGSAMPAKTRYLAGSGAREGLRAAAAAGGGFEIAVLNGADLLPLADALPPETRRVLVSHNVESRIIAAQAARSPLGALLGRDVAKTRRAEIRGARRMDLIVAISAEDGDWYAAAAPETPVEVIAAGFSGTPHAGPRPASGLPLRAGYLARIGWWPNREGAEWFAREVLPALPPGRIEAHFFGPGTERWAGRRPDIVAHGFVDDLGEVWGGMHFTLCPILSGSGINIKLVESLWNRVPVLATPHACRGLPEIADPGLACVPPGEWAGFLASGRALGLAAAGVGAETAARFGAEANGRRLAGLLGALLDRPARR